MKIRVHMLGAALFCLAILPYPAATAATPPAFTATLESGKIAHLSASEKNALQRLYEKNGFAPFWLNSSSLTPKGEFALNKIIYAGQEGLRPEDYQASTIRSLLGENNPASLHLADMMLSVGLLRFSNDVEYGRYNPERKNTVSIEFFQKVLDTPASQLESAYATLLPPYHGYPVLRATLAKYRTLQGQGQWPKIPSYMLLREGDKIKEVATLRHFLFNLGDISSDSGSDQFDDELAEGVKHYQARHGIEPDGVVGRFTREALIVPPEERIRQITMAMERMRWLPRDTNSRYILVNVPAYRLTAVKRGNVSINMKIIVGRVARQTPLVSRTIGQVIFNPSWGVPARIASEDLLPKIQKNPEMFDMNNFQLYKYVGGKAIEVNPRNINWDKMRPEEFDRFTLRQEPGGTNPLGRVKFQLVPDASLVYLHDTYEKQLFNNQDRAFSSGCVRLEAPKELANFILDGQGAWDTDKVYNAFDHPRGTQYVPVTSKIPVHIVYWTAWVDERNTINFGYDVYKKDEELESVMFPST